MQQYGLIVIGGGPGGYEAAAIAASQGVKVALIEKDLLGGTCLNRGCVPTKCLCAAAERLHAIQSAAGFGITVDGPVTADYGAAVSRAAGVVDTLRTDVEALLKDVDIFHGEARLSSGHTVVAGANFLKGRQIIIATGSKPAPLPIEGSEYTLTSDEFLMCRELPARVAVIGGGVIGLEFASVIAAYGREVTVLEFCPEILPGIDAEIAKRLRSYLSRRGVKFVLNARVTAVSESRTVTYEAKGKTSAVESDMVICAVGRRPVLPEGLADAGVTLDERGFISVDDRYETASPGIFAIGDVNGRCMLAHAATAQARVVTGQTAAFGIVPSVVFTLPECASVGMKTADAEGLKASKIPYSANAKAQASGDDTGMLKLVYRETDLTVVGCQAVGAHAGDLIAEATLAIDSAYTLRRLALDTVSAHPGLSELLQAAAAAALP